MSTTDVSLTRAAALKAIGDGIELDNDKQRLVLTGKNSFYMGRTKPRLVRARNVRVRIHNGYLVSPDNKHPSLPVAEVTFEQGTDRVISVEKLS